MTHKPINIFLTSFDWDDLARKKPENIIAKLNRDKLYPEKNNFLILSWGPGRYEKNIRPNIKIIQRSAKLRAFRPLYDALTYSLAPRIIRKQGFNPDIIMAYDFPFVFALSRAARLTKVPLVLCLTNLPRHYINSRNSLRLPKIWYQKFVEKFAVRKIDALYTINEVTRKYAEELGIPVDRAVIFSVDSISQDLDILAKAPLGTTREKYRIPSHHKILFTAARLEGEKGLERLIRAIADLDRNDISLIIAGRGELEPLLKDQASRLGLGDRTHFVGHLSRLDYWSVMKDADIFILLSHAEALGIVFWEAMYLKIPVIGSRASGIMESIGEGEERGYLWEPKDGIEAFRKRIDACLSDGAKEKVNTAKEYVDKKLADKSDIYNVYELCLKYL